MSNRFQFDTAVGEDKGKRSTQEDFVFANFPENGCAGLAVLSDGMGGHQDSVIASKFLVTGVAGELSMDIENFPELEEALPGRLSELTHFANLQLGSFMRQRRIRQTMGATLVSVAISRDKLFWASVGDSPLYLLRNGELQRLNVDHSMSPQIDFMVQSGMMSEDKARNHPDRSILTSAIYGKTIKKIDCPESHFPLEAHDVLLIASDGIESLERSEMLEILSRRSARSSAEIVAALLEAIQDHDVEDQDNTAMVVVRVIPAAHAGDCATTMPGKAKSAPATPWSLAKNQDDAPKGVSDADGSSTIPTDAPTPG